MKRSFIEVSPDSHFPIQNLPYGIFSTRDNPKKRVGVAIGEYVLDLPVAIEWGVFRDSSGLLDAEKAFNQSTLNTFMSMRPGAWSEARITVEYFLDADIKEISYQTGRDELRENPEFHAHAFHLQKDVTMHMPVDIGDYTDFYSSKEHATNVGIMFRGKENALMPNYLHLPVGYHGRASSIVLSGTEIHRPQGQMLPQGASTPIFGPSKLLDFELEMGYFIGIGNPLGEPIADNDARFLHHNHVFGMVLVNDWSARDIQAWEYQPLGPFLAKNFATSISPWVVPTLALEPFRTTPPVQDPAPLPYLQLKEDFTYDIQLEVGLKSAQMDTPHIISRSNFKHLYWTIAQQVNHHTITGCNLRPGDLLASGTISGPTPDSYGSLLELTWRGANPITLPSGETRKFLEDGDTLTMTGYCQGDGYRVGFGDVTGTIIPALDLGF
jgi:fumarylacetoacetase